MQSQFQSHYGRNGTRPMPHLRAARSTFQSHYGRNGTRVSACAGLSGRMFQSHYGRNGTAVDRRRATAVSSFQSHYGRNGTKARKPTNRGRRKVSKPLRSKWDWPTRNLKSRISPVSKPLRSKWDRRPVCRFFPVNLFQSHYGRNGTSESQSGRCAENEFQSHYGRNGT